MAQNGKQLSESAKSAKAARGGGPGKKSPKRIKEMESPQDNNLQERTRMISEAAYLRAEMRDFSGGDPIQDWLEAEIEVDQLLGEQGFITSH